MREVWRAASPPRTFLFSTRRGLRPRLVEKKDFWGDVVSPNPSLRKVSNDLTLDSLAGVRVELPLIDWAWMIGERDGGGGRLLLGHHDPQH